MITTTMEPDEFFDDVTKKFPRWWRPHETWRPDVLAILRKFHGRQIAAAHAIIIRRETRPSLEELEELLGEQSASLFPAEKKVPLEEVVTKWMDNNGLTEAYEKAGHNVRFNIARLIDIIRYDDDWSVRLGMQAGLSTVWRPWERIEHLHMAAYKAHINGRSILSPGYRPPVGKYEVKLPPPPAWLPEDVRADRAKRRDKIIARHGGLMNGTAIANDPEWQQMNEELDALEAQARLEHYGDTFASN